MAFAKGSCTNCGELELEREHLKLRFCADTSQGSCIYNCPSCGRPNTKILASQIMGLLVKEGVPLEVWSLPAELSEPRPQGAITCTDTINLLEANNVEELIGS